MNNTTFQGEQYLQHQNIEADIRKVTQVQNVIIGAAPAGATQGVPHTMQQNPEQVSVDVSAAASPQSQQQRAMPSNNQNTANEINKLLSDNEVKDLHTKIKDFKEPIVHLYGFLVATGVLLCVLLFVLCLAFNNIDANIAIYVCAAIAVIGIFLIYMVGHLAKHLFKMYNKYQIKKFALLIDYAKDINKVRK